MVTSTVFSTEGAIEIKNSLRTNPIMPPCPSSTLADEPVNPKTLSDVPLSISRTVAAAKFGAFLIEIDRRD